jgi:aspartate racemase
MAQQIDTGSSARCLVPIQPDGSRPPLFCVHDINGHVLNFRALAHGLGADQPVYGLQLVGLDGTEAPLGRVEDMAARYLSEIRAAGLTGPYRLCGYSMGGLVAYEMAQQLRDAGETVDLLALLDTFPRPGLRRSTLTEWVTQGGNDLGDRRPRSVTRFVAWGARNVALNASTALKRRSFGVAWRFCERSMTTVPPWLHKPAAANLLASRDYRARPYDGDVMLFKADPYRNDRLELRESWRNLIGGRVDVRPVPGLHHEILEAPHVHALARLLSECLEDGTRPIARQNESTAAD